MGKVPLVCTIFVLVLVSSSYGQFFKSSFTNLFNMHKLKPVLSYKLYGQQEGPLDIDAGLPTIRPPKEFSNPAELIHQLAHRLNQRNSQISNYMLEDKHSTVPMPGPRPMPVYKRSNFPIQNPLRLQQANNEFNSGNFPRTEILNNPNVQRQKPQVSQMESNNQNFQQSPLPPPSLAGPGVLID